MRHKHIYVPLITPMSRSEKICHNSVSNIVDFLDSSVDGFIPCLTSGEGWKLSDSSWEEMLEICTALAGKNRVMVGIERPTTESVLNLIEIAHKYQPSAILITTPFGSEVSQNEMMHHYESAAVNSDIDIIIYNESALSKNVMSIHSLLEVCKLNNVVGIKDSPGSSRPMSEISALRSGGVKYYLGWEEDLHSGRENDGSIVSMANLNPELCKECEHSDVYGFKKELVAEAISEFSLSESDWYRYMKLHLYQRGIISSPSLVV